MKNPLIIVGIVLVILGVGIYLLPKAPASPAIDSSAKEFTLRIEGTKLVEGPATMTVKKGDVVLITIFNDEEEEFHLHGYDKSVDLIPGVASELRVVADAAGRFPAELELSKTEIATLEVLP